MGKDLIYKDCVMNAIEYWPYDKACEMIKNMSPVTTNEEKFVIDLIHYIFCIMDADDQNLYAELVCRKLHKYGLIDHDEDGWHPREVKYCEDTECEDCPVFLNDTDARTYEERDDIPCCDNLRKTRRD